MSSAKPSGLRRPLTAHLDSCGIHDSHDPVSDDGALHAKKDFGHGFSSLAETSENELQPMDASQQSIVLNPTHHVCSKLVPSIVGSSCRFPETQVSGRQRQEDILTAPPGLGRILLLRFRECDVGVVSVGKDVEMEFVRDVIGSFHRGGWWLKDVEGVAGFA